MLLVGGAEIYRNTEQNIERRQYPGGVFDPLNLASGNDERAFNLKTAELKHGRLAMIAFLGEASCMPADHACRACCFWALCGRVTSTAQGLRLACRSPVPGSTRCPDILNYLLPSVRRLRRAGARTG